VGGRLLRYRVIRDVRKGEHHNFLGRAAREGEVFFRFAGATYGCIDTYGGVALSEKDGEYPFFEFPVDAVERLDD
jgi:hypothetical protein